MNKKLSETEIARLKAELAELPLGADKCAQVERLFGRISARKVYYRGPSFSHPRGVDYVNVENYLQRMGDW